MKNWIFFFAGLVTLILLSSCATIIGGSNYYANVTVEDHPNATIKYKGSVIGTGRTSLSIPRKDANKVAFTVSKEGCEDKEYLFHRRVFRGWAFVGSLALMPVVEGVPIPITTIVDLATGSYYKPNVNNPYIYKDNYKNYNYTLRYQCNTGGLEQIERQNVLRETTTPKEDKLIELKELFDKGMITEEEYQKARMEILSK
jgi:hypothetical protein